LKRLDINCNDKRHKYLGDVTKYFTSELVKDGYLRYEQDNRSDPPTFKFKWGQRAQMEITKLSVLDFVCQVYGGKDTCTPQEWIIQYEDATKEINQNN
jgi:melanoma-associated antigen